MGAEGGPRTLVTAGTQDDKSLFNPCISIFCTSAQPWVPITQDTENYPGYLSCDGAAEWRDQVCTRDSCGGRFGLRYPTKHSSTYT